MGILERFGQRLRDLRQERGWSEEDLAERWGVDATRVTAVEAGQEEVRILDLDRIAQVFELSIADLLDGTESTDE